MELYYPRKQVKSLAVTKMQRLVQKLPEGNTRKVHTQRVHKTGYNEFKINTEQDFRVQSEFASSRLSHK